MRELRSYELTGDTVLKDRFSEFESSNFSAMQRTSLVNECKFFMAYIYML